MSFSIPTLRSFIIKGNTSTSRDWSTYCEFTNSSPSSYGILLDGTEAYLASVTFFGSVAVNFNQEVQNLIIDHGATVTYSIDRGGPGAACSYTPNPLTGNVTVGMSDIVITYPPSCNDSVDINITLTIAGMPVGWWDTYCCTIGYCTYNGDTGWSTQALGIVLEA